MRSIKFLDKNIKLISAIIIATVIYGRNNFGYVDMWAVVSNVIIDAIAFLYCGYLCLQDKKYAKKVIFSPVILWAVAFFVFEECYHFAGMGYIFSTRTTLLTIGAAILVYVIVRFNKGYTMDVLCLSAELVIMGTFLASLYLDRWAISWWQQGYFYRVGTNWCYGNVIEVANLYFIMLVPILYKLIVEKQIKRYLPITIIACIMVFLSASKATIAGIAIVIALLLLFNSKDKKEIFRNLAVLVVLAAVGLILMFKVQFFYNLVGVRVEELVVGVLNYKTTEPDLTSSTGQRFAAISAALEHWDEKPWFGHGIYSFCQQEYSYVEYHHWGNGTESFESMQVHMNFVEMLFSFGIVGIVVFYWFPVYLFIQTIRCRTKNLRLASFSFLLTMFVLNVGLDMYYKYIIPYFAYAVCYCLLKEAHEK